jgi:hypothetical protein
MNPMRLILQNMKDPVIEVMDLTYENQLNGGTNTLDLTQYAWIDNHSLSHFLSTNQSIIQLMNSYEIKIQQISSYRGVDVCLANICYDNIMNDNNSLENNLIWISCDPSIHVILYINMTFLALLMKEFAFSYEVWRKIMENKMTSSTINIERQGLMMNKLGKVYIDSENVMFLNIKDIGIVKFLSKSNSRNSNSSGSGGGNSEEYHFQYLYGFTLFMDHFDIKMYESNLYEFAELCNREIEKEKQSENESEKHRASLKQQEQQQTVQPEQIVRTEDSGTSLKSEDNSNLKAEVNGKEGEEQDDDDEPSSLPPPPPIPMTAVPSTPPPFKTPSKRNPDVSPAMLNEYASASNHNDGELLLTPVPAVPSSSSFNDDKDDTDQPPSISAPPPPIPSSLDHLPVSSSDNSTGEASLDPMNNDSNFISKSASLDEASMRSNSHGNSLNNSASNIGSLDFEERDDMTLKERKELKRRKEEYEKQRKLQEFLRVDKSPSSFLPTITTTTTTTMGAASVDSRHPIQGVGGDLGGGSGKGSVKRGSVKDRFLTAQQHQHEQENERLNKFKNDPNKKIETSNVKDVRSKWNDTVNADGNGGGGGGTNNSLYHQNVPMSQEQVALASAAFNNSNNNSNKESGGAGNAGGGEEDRAVAVGKLRSKWNSVLDNTKETEKNRFQNTKLKTISQFRVTHGTGIVKKRIDEWEELFLQIAATQEQLEEFLKVAHALSLKNEYDGLTPDQLAALREEFVMNCTIPEDFIINDTHIYSSKVCFFFLFFFFYSYGYASSFSFVFLSFSCLCALLILFLLVTPIFLCFSLSFSLSLWAFLPC